MKQPQAVSELVGGRARRGMPRRMGGRGEGGRVTHLYLVVAAVVSVRQWRDWKDRVEPEVHAVIGGLAAVRRLDLEADAGLREPYLVDLVEYRYKVRWFPAALVQVNPERDPVYGDEERLMRRRTGGLLA